MKYRKRMLLTSAIKPAVRLAALLLCANPFLGGINWKAVWLEPYNLVALEPGAAQKYTIKGLDGSDHIADLTRNPSLKMDSLDPNILEIDRENTRFMGKSLGKTELRISFSEATSLVRVIVRLPEPQ